MGCIPMQLVFPCSWVQPSELCPPVLKICWKDWHDHLRVRLVKPSWGKGVVLHNYFLFFYFWEILYSQGWPQNHYVGKGRLELLPNLPASASLVLFSDVCHHAQLDQHFFFKQVVCFIEVWDLYFTKCVSFTANTCKQRLFFYVLAARTQITTQTLY